MAPTTLQLIAVVAICAFTVAVLMRATTIGSQRPPCRRAGVYDDIHQARRRTDEAGYYADAEMRRLYRRRTGRAVPPPNPFKYGG